MHNKTCTFYIAKNECVTCNARRQHFYVEESNGVYLSTITVLYKVPIIVSVASL